MKRSRSTMMMGLCLALAAACGDDGMQAASGETGGTTEGTSASSSTGVDPVTADGDTSTSAGSTDEGSTTADGSSTGGTTGAVDDAGSSSTGAPSGCEDLDEEQACNRTAGCTWVGSPNQGTCVSTADMCNGVMFQMQCNFIPGCVWNEDSMVCMPSA